MSRGEGGTGDIASEVPPPPSRRHRGEDTAVYREDDENFKDRLKENLVNHWLLNTIITLVVFVVVFYLLTDSLFIGLLAGLLVLIASNLSNILWRIRDFERWEVFSNGVKLGYDPQGKAKFVRFSDIRSIQVRRGLWGDVMVIDLGGRKLRYSYRSNQEMLDLMRDKYEAFNQIQRVPAGEG